MQYKNLFKFGAQSPGVYRLVLKSLSKTDFRLIIVKVPEKVPIGTYLIEAQEKG